jgi:hypothetical protein
MSQTHTHDITDRVEKFALSPRLLSQTIFENGTRRPGAENFQKKICPAPQTPQPKITT